MTLSQARDRAATAIEETMPKGALHEPPRKLDTVSPRDLVKLAQALGEAETDVLGDIGPAIVCVMAQGRTAPSEAITITVYTVTRGRLGVANSRGLGVVDKVEDALRTLPGEFLPSLLVDSAVATTPDALKAGNVSITRTSTVWPTATVEGSSPRSARPSGMMAIRTHFAGRIANALELTTGALDLLRRGQTEDRQRDALWRGLLPRASVSLMPGKLVVSQQEWDDSDGTVWHADRGGRQKVIATVGIHARSYDAADDLASELSGELDFSNVVWPGSFRALVQIPDPDNVGQFVMDRQTLHNGVYNCRVLVSSVAPAVWDYEAGAACAKVVATVDLMDPISRATRSASVSALSKRARITAARATG